MSLDEFMGADYEEGYHYELIDGKLYVSPLPDLPHECIGRWLSFKLELYAHNYPEVMNFVTPKARVFVPGRHRVTNPEPDLAAYRNFPLHKPIRERRWQDVSPLLVVEVLSEDDADKDLVRNVELYLQVPSIKEYWILDTRHDPDQPIMYVYRRHGRRWRRLEVPYLRPYTTRLLPGFELVLDPAT
jgi:Uma2 family endonuclease